MASTATLLLGGVAWYELTEVAGIVFEDQNVLMAAKSGAEVEKVPMESFVAGTTAVGLTPGSLDNLWSFHVGTEETMIDKISCCSLLPWDIKETAEMGVHYHCPAMPLGPAVCYDHEPLDQLACLLGNPYFDINPPVTRPVFWQIWVFFMLYRTTCRFI